MLRVYTDPVDCRHLWQTYIPDQHLVDRWDVRVCFQRQYKRMPYFITSETGGVLRAFLPLSWIEEQGIYGYYPGEVWDGKTWLEQNRLYATSADALADLFEQLKTAGVSYHLRYMSSSPEMHGLDSAVDEIGYLFTPGHYGHAMENYWAVFSGKSRKQIHREVASLEALGVEYRFDDCRDFDLMVSLNKDRYGLYSYFGDPRFTESFRSLMTLLAEHGWLKIVTLYLGGQPAAVDMGAVYNGVYTLLAGGTNKDFPGVAKLINLFHMQRACDERYDAVDFLCGDFSWKSRFHLTPRPLYALKDIAAVPAQIMKVRSVAAGRLAAGVTHG